MSRLIFLDDPQRAALELPEGESTLGRRPTNDIQMNHETVSGRHASFSVANDCIRVTDLESTNGTFVNGQMIRETVELKHQDIVKFGRQREIILCLLKVVLRRACQTRLTS